MKPKKTKTLRVYFLNCDPYESPPVLHPHRLTGRWKIKTENDGEPFLCVEVKTRSIFDNFFRGTQWVGEDWLKVEEVEECINECAKQ